MAQIVRTKNATRNIVWGVIEKIVSLLMPFICRTIFIRVLGQEYLGLNSLFTAVLQVLSISELGFGTAIVFSMYKPIAEDDEKTLCALLNVYRKVYLTIGTAILIAGLAIIPILPYFIKGTYPKEINLYVLYLIFLGNTVIGYYLYAYKQAIFSAYQRNDLISKRTTIINFCSSVFKIVVLLLSKSYYLYIIVVPITTICTNLANAYLVNKVFPNIKCFGDITLEMKNSIKKRIIGLLSFKIYNVIFTSVDTIVISAFLGLVPLGIYNNYYYVQTSIISFLTIITSSITAGIGNKMVTNSVDDNYADFIKFAFANGWICSWCATCLLCLYQHFIECWVGEEYLLPFPTMYLMVLYFFIPRLTTMTYTYREAAGLWWEDRFRPLIATVVNLTLNIILVKHIGMNGVLISTLICSVFINIPWGSIILFRSYFKRSPKEYFLKIGFYFIVTNIVAFITLVICNLLPAKGWILLFLKATICCILPNALFYLFYKKQIEFVYTKELVINILKKLKEK